MQGALSVIIGLACSEVGFRAIGSLKMVGKDIQQAQEILLLLHANTHYLLSTLVFLISLNPLPTLGCCGHFSSKIQAA